MRLTLLTVLTMVAFGANSVLNRAAVDGAGMDPLIFAFVRVAAGSAVLAALVLIRKGRQVWPGWLPPLWLGLYMIGFSLAYQSLDAGVGALILFGAVQVTMFGGALLGGEVIPARRWAGMALALGGLVWLSWPDPGTQVATLDVAAMLAAGLGWGLYSLAGRRAEDPLGATAVNFGLCLPLVGAAALVGQGGFGSPAGVGLAVASGALTSGLGYALWYRVLPQLQPSTAGVVQLSTPVVALVGGLLLLGESLDLHTLLSAALILGGIGVAVGRRANR